MDNERTPAERVRAGAGLPPHRWTKVDDPGSEAVIAAYQTVIAGGGPAGLTAAYELSRNRHACVALEADPKLVGGISRTDQYKGYRFDIGGHRFFSKSKEVEDLWTEILPDDMLERPRSSRIYYNGKFFAYPLKAGEALWKLGVFEAGAFQHPLADRLPRRFRRGHPEMGRAR